MKIESPEFRHGATIPTRFTCEGEGHSPSLRWSGEPEETRSFALLVEDPDAPKGTFTHWILYDLPASLHELPERNDGLGTNGRNDFQHEGWGGPCPPPGHGGHRYVFRLYALDVPSLELDAGAERSAFEEKLQGHVLGEADLMGRFERRAN